MTTGATVSLTLFRQKWIFHIRTTDANGNPIHFVDESGSIVDDFDISDAEYSFKRGLVQDQYGSPMWMFYKPMFGQMNSDPWDTGVAADAMNLAHLIDNAIEVSGNDLIINLGMVFPENAFKQILSQTWASIVSKQYSISIGCWDGNLYYDSTPSPTPITGEELGYTWERVTNETVGKGDGTTTVFSLANAPVVPHSETIYIDGVPTTAYTINYTIGEITFTTAPANNKRISADYTYIISEFQTAWWPIQSGSEKVYLNGIVTTAYEIDYTTGAVTLTDGSDANYTVTIDYTYIGGFPDWFETDKPVTYWRHKSRSPYDKTSTITRPPGVTFTNGYRYVGTGPYRVITFDAVAGKVELAQNPYYWKGWNPFPGGTTPRNHFQKIVILYIADWGARESAFLAGDIDVCAVPRANMFELLDPTTGEPITPGIKTIKKIEPALSMDAMHYTFTLDPATPYMPKRKDNSADLPNFFNDTHVRKAFSYAFNHTGYIKDAWFNEAIYRNNMLVYGLVPDYYDPTTGGYEINYTAAEAELKAAKLSDGKSLWDAGFTITLAYNTGNDQRRIACEMIQRFFQNLGSQFEVNVVEIDWDTYLDLFEAFQLPIWSIGWLADFADADNFARPYMHSGGDFAYFQGYTADNGWGTRKDQLIDTALSTPDGTARAALYKELQQIYYNDAPSLPIDIPVGRRWCWYWVKGWYYNALYPAQYYYSMYKEDTCWYNISGPTPGVPDDVTNMRDVTYLLLHFNAKAPEPGKTPDPKWVGTYGFGGVDPYGDRICNMRDVTFTILHFNHRNVP
jgi:ABC-type transport system substrate-binding protein